MTDAERRVREAGAVPLSKLMPKGLSRTGQAAFAEALARAGLERTGTRIRVPIGEQLLARLASEGPLPTSELRKCVVGAAGPEIKRSVVKLASGGSVVLPVRDAREWLALPSDRELSAVEIEALKAGVKRLATMLSWLKPRKGAPPRTLDRHELAAALAHIPRAAGGQAPTAVDPALRVLEAIRKTTDAGTGLARVPHAVRAVLEAMTVSQACSALLRLHSDRLIELRPESGVGLLSEQDAALCPRGPRGVVLSFARLLSHDERQARS